MPAAADDDATTVQGSSLAVQPEARSPLRAVAMPSEHGGWGLTTEPGLLGLLVEPSLAGAALAVAALLLFLVRQPVHHLADVAPTIDQELTDEVWVTTAPPIEGKVRSLALQLEHSHEKWRLVHCGYGPDMTEPLALLVSQHSPALDLLPRTNGAGERPTDASLLPTPAWRTALIVNEGTPLRVMIDAQLAAGDNLGAVVLLHPRLI